MPKLYPRSMTAGVRAEVSDLGYRGQDIFGVACVMCLISTEQRRYNQFCSVEQSEDFL